MAIAVGTVLDGKYRLVRLLGEGGMGSVYEAEHTFLRRRMAIKVLAADFSRSADAVKRFCREAQAAAQIGHENICEVLDIGQTNEGQPYIVMPVLQGKSLSAALAEAGVLPVGRAVDIATQMLEALAAAHATGIVHRDMKPDNVFLTRVAGRDDFVKLLDFGISKVRGAGDTTAKLTQAGTVLGTPAYMSPEQASGETDVDERVDVWAVGVMLYEMLAGGSLFPGDNYNKVLFHVLTAPIPSLRARRPDVPPALEAAVMGALERDAARRFRNAVAFREALLGAWAAEEPEAIPIGVLPTVQAPPPQASVSPPQASVSPPQASVSPPQASVSPPQASVSPPQASVPPAGASAPSPQPAVAAQAVGARTPSGGTMPMSVPVPTPLPGRVRTAPLVVPTPAPASAARPAPLPAPLPTPPPVAPTAPSSLATPPPPVPTPLRMQPQVVTIKGTPGAIPAQATPLPLARPAAKRNPVVVAAVAAVLLVGGAVVFVLAGRGSSPGETPPAGPDAPSTASAVSPTSTAGVQSAAERPDVARPSVVDAGSASPPTIVAVAPPVPAPAVTPAPSPTPTPTPTPTDRDGGMPDAGTVPTREAGAGTRDASGTRVAMGLLSVATMPRTEVCFDGVSLGWSPFARKEVPAGNHTLAFIDTARGIGHQEQVSIVVGRETWVRLNAAQLGAAPPPPPPPPDAGVRPPVEEAGTRPRGRDAGARADQVVEVRIRTVYGRDGR